MMGAVLFFCDFLDAADGTFLLERFPGKTIVAIPEFPPVASERVPGVSLAPRAPMDQAHADALDDLAIRLAGSWWAADPRRFEQGPHRFPANYAVDVFSEMIDLLQQVYHVDAALREHRPEAVAVKRNLRPAFREAVGFLCRLRGLEVVEPAGGGGRKDARADFSSLKHWGRLHWGRLRYRQATGRARKNRPVVFWAYPKIRNSRLADDLYAQGVSFLIAEGEETFCQKGIPYVFVRPDRPDEREWSGRFDRLPLACSWEEMDLAPLVRAALARFLAPRFARAAALASALSRDPPQVDAAVTPDFIGGVHGVVHDWAESRGIPRIGIQHGAPLADYWLHLPGTWNRGTILAWGGASSASFFRGHGFPRSHVRPVGSADNDRFSLGFSRAARPDLLLCTLTGQPFTSVRESHAINERLVSDLLSAARTFPGLEVVFKTHPRQTPAERRFLAACLARVPDVRARLSGGESIENLLSRARLLATRTSSTAVEAALAGIPIVHLDYALSDHPWMTGFLSREDLPRGGTAAALEGAIRQALGKGAPPPAFAAAWENGDGAATGRVVREIRDAVTGAASARPSR